jgi:hypothetical protein
MKSFGLIAVLFAGSMFGQTVNLPTLGLLGASFNQTAQPRWSLLASAVYQNPGTTNANWYASTSVDGVPVKRIINGATIYSLNVSVRQGENYVVFRSSDATLSNMPKLVGFVGADLGAGFQQATPSGTNVNWAAAGTVGLIGRIGSPTSKFGWFAVARAIHLAGDSANVITPIGEVGVAYKF